jgi:hypothetical protein
MRAPPVLAPPRRVSRRIVAVIAVFLTVALTEGASAASATSATAGEADSRLVVMTQNLYLGANLQPLFGRSGLDLIGAAAVAYAHVVQTDFPDRADAIATEIAAEGPEVVGLQEVALWKEGPDPAHLATTYDFLTILLNALADHGASYRVVAVGAHFSGALPIGIAPDGTLTPWVSFTDRDAIIVRNDLPTSEFDWSNPTAQNFQRTFDVPLGGYTIQIPRGWTSVDVRFQGRSYRIAETHLEAYSQAVRDDQARELLASLEASPLPVVLAGDINSLPTDGTGPYGLFAGAGYVDSWTQAMDGDPGFTSGQPDDLNCTLASTLDHRVDYILHDDDPALRAVPMTGDVVGDSPNDCTATDPPLWPSDHAGVVVGLRGGTS